MRTSLVLFAAGMIATAGANATPISTKEIALMLRSGYSSESVLREITSRRVLDALDPATRKSMLEFGASPAIISALETGAYAASASQVDEAKQKNADAAARRAAQIEQDQKLNTRYQSEAQARAKTHGSTQSSTGNSIIESVKGKLVRCRDGTISPADGVELENKKLIALYYSAHWCAPCRKFTPELVDYYNRAVPQHPEFEIIFISFDKSRFNWETYLRESKMPWLAIDYDQLAGMEQVKALGGAGIPSLLLLDATGHVLASSYDGDKYLGPQNALAALDKIFAQNPGGPVAQAR